MITLDKNRVRLYPVYLLELIFMHLCKDLFYYHKEVD